MGSSIFVLSYRAVSCCRAWSRCAGAWHGTKCRWRQRVASSRAESWWGTSWRARWRCLHHKCDKSDSSTTNLRTCLQHHGTCQMRRPKLFKFLGHCYIGLMTTEIVMPPESLSIRSLRWTLWKTPRPDSRSQSKPFPSRIAWDCVTREPAQGTTGDDFLLNRRGRRGDGAGVLRPKRRWTRRAQVMNRMWLSSIGSRRNWSRMIIALNLGHVRT